MATLKANLRAAQFDSLRRTEGISGDLALYQATATDYTALAVITGGWFVQRERDAISGDQFLAVRVVMTDANAALLATTSTQMAAAVIMGSRYKIKAKVAPLGDPAIWMLQCDPTGEPL